MKNIIFTLIFAFILSLVLHYVTFMSVNETLKEQKLLFPTSNKKKLNKKGYTSIKYVKLIKPKQKPKKDIQKELPKKTTNKQTVKKTKKITLKNKIVKKMSTKKQKIKKISKNIKKVKKINIPKEETINLKDLFTLDEKQKIEESKKKQDNQDIQREAFKKQKEIQEIKNLDELTQQYIKLYGDQFFGYSKEQKRFIKNNISKIGKITQKYLEYPRVSIRTRQQGISVVEFILHPNGDISKLLLLDPSGYTALDSNSMQTIRIAYKDYPKPIEPVKIKIYVQYILR